ncbi:hypothetical protein BV22DRAFT_1115736 [Leucogyrophana mollusca]|uniref:Uncharacterized protein n=1 Tax=Leucogyrophana mollusca TaxID=85980 RepID=A0ACB8BZG6_9AGAM|nr:hypothetical protein BV22DRAFT_1115736 [Leucogyrophana mollusca]
MSVSVDDLVASLSANHIGQEAIDLAALQAQLAQTLFAHQFSSPSCSSSPYTQNTVPRRDPGHIQHCTTPTGRTPSSSFSWPSSGYPSSDATRRRSSSFANSYPRRASVDEAWCDLDETEEDERMVEDILTPSSPQTPSFYARHPQGMQHPSKPSNYPPAPPPSYNVTPTTESLFTAQDPFYIAQLQAAQVPSQSSYLGHVGRPSTQSPFLMGHQSRWETHAQPMAVRTSTAFER